MGRAVGRDRASAYVMGALVAGLFLLAPACDLVEDPARVPSTLRQLNGAALSGVAGTALSDSLKVIVLDQDDRPLTGVEVGFTVRSGGGAIQPGARRTDDAGIAAAQWVLGLGVGAQAAMAEVTGSALRPVTMDAVARAGPASRIIKVAGDAQSAIADHDLPDSLAVRVVDAHGNALSGAEVGWAVTSGQGAIVPASDTTDSGGMVRASWHLPPAAGPATAEARIASDTARFSARGTAGPAARVVKISGDGQTAVVDNNLADPLVVSVTDVSGNFIAGAPVGWAVASGQGTITPAGATTDSLGVARAVWHLSKAVGPETAEATIAGDTTRFSARGTAGPATRIVKISGDGQSAVVAHDLADSLVVRVTDAHGNIVAGASVSWTAASGQGSVAPAVSTTDSLGLVRSAWRLSKVAATTTAIAAIAADTARFSARGLPGPIDTLRIIADDELVFSDDSVRLSVRSVDAFGNSIDDTGLTWSSTNVTAASVRSSGPTAATVTGGAEGIAWIMASAAGGRLADSVKLIALQGIAGYESRDTKLMRADALNGNGDVAGLGRTLITLRTPVGTTYSGRPIQLWQQGQLKDFGIADADPVERSYHHSYTVTGLNGGAAAAVFDQYPGNTGAQGVGTSALMSPPPASTATQLGLARSQGINDSGTVAGYTLNQTGTYWHLGFVWKGGPSRSSTTRFSAMALWGRPRPSPSTTTGRSPQTRRKPLRPGSSGIRWITARRMSGTRDTSRRYPLPMLPASHGRPRTSTTPDTCW